MANLYVRPNLSKNNSFFCLGQFFFNYSRNLNSSWFSRSNVIPEISKVLVALCLSASTDTRLFSYRMIVRLCNVDYHLIMLFSFRCASIFEDISACYLSKVGLCATCFNIKNICQTLEPKLFSVLNINSVLDIINNVIFW